jgi:hypothetical protein
MHVCQVAQLKSTLELLKTFHIIVSLLCCVKDFHRPDQTCAIFIVPIPSETCAKKKFCSITLVGVVTSIGTGVIPMFVNSLLQLQDVGCLRDLPHLYEVTTAEDVYNAYNYLSLDDGSLFTCIGVAGTEAGKGEIIEVAEELPGKKIL